MIMRILFFILMLFLLKEESFSQGDGNVFFIDHLSKDGILLNRGLKFYAGDDPAFASPDFDDSRWQSIDPTQDIYSLPQLWKTNICWLRLHLSLDSNVAKQHLLFLIQQTGASEVYLNGHLLASLGSISKDSTKTKGISPVTGSFIPFPVSSSGSEILAVRFALQRGIFYSNFDGRPRPALALTVAETKTVSDNINSDNVVYFELARVGIFLILSVLHLALFRYNRSQKANFYFFIYAFLSCVLTLTADLTDRHVSMVSYKLLLLTAVTLLYYLNYLFFILAVYKVFHYHSRWVLWVVAAMAIASVFLFSSSLRVTFWLANIFSILPILEVIRVSFIALQANQRGAKIVMSGAVVFVAFFVLFVLFALKYLPAGPNWIYGNFAFNIGFLSLPIAISVYLALEASYASRMLGEKLEEVQRLSEQRREQEKEKQQLLASQNEMLEKQVTERTSALKQSLEELKSTQAQLIQSEKMASLGEVTAGIAHEIQNPLNFVNNFSDVNQELLAELKEEATKGNNNEVNAIADDVIDNEQKINHHGKRADAIVKSMLQHSRASSGQKEPTDINKLADEYLRLSYHGMRARDKSFNAEFKTDFDESIGKINVVPQDIGRVLLNLYNNAFYAVSKPPSPKGEQYKPLVTVTTRKVKLAANNAAKSLPLGTGGLEIIVTDNGNGIPQNIVDKIFQPFFTTKPTGQGTGLGLSLAYDIIKAHGGEIKVNTKEGEGSEFIIQL
jgi:signal transduction histidine kinase